jgi:hypothetical protein
LIASSPNVPSVDAISRVEIRIFPLN